MDDGFDSSSPCLQIPVSVTYAYLPSAEKAIPVHPGLLVRKQITLLSFTYPEDLGTSDRILGDVGLTVRHNKPICSNANESGPIVVSINLVNQARRGPEVVTLAISRVGEVDVQVLGVNRDIIERVELAAEEVIEKNRHIVRLDRVHDE